MYVTGTFTFTCEYRVLGLHVADFDASITYSGTWDRGSAPDVVFSDFQVHGMDTTQTDAKGRHPHVWVPADAALMIEMRRHLEHPAVQDNLADHIAENAPSSVDYDDYRYHNAAE